jgi:hypothetical protein
VTFLRQEAARFAIDPSQLGPGENTLEATVRFIARSNTDPRVLRAELPSCAGS